MSDTAIESVSSVRFVPSGGRMGQLTERDRFFLRCLWRFGVLLRDQAHELAFLGCARRRVNRRLKALSDAGLITSFQLPLGTALPRKPVTADSVDSTMGASQYAYCLAAGSIALVAADTGADSAEVRRRVDRGAPSYIAHAVAAAQAALAFHRLPPDGLLRLAAYHAEGEVRHAYQYRLGRGHTTGAGDAVAWKTELLKPDGLAVLTDHSGIPLYCFLEVDLGHASRRAFALKARQYLRYSQTGAFAHRYGNAVFRVLAVTTTERRSEQILKAVQDEGREAAALFRVATLSVLDAAGPLAPIWCWIDGTGGRLADEVRATVPAGTRKEER